MIRKQSGFTLIELVIVIVVLGILSAVAIPNFVDLRNEARQGRLDGIAGALASASVINYTQCLAPGVGGASGTVVNDTELPTAGNCFEFGAMVTTTVTDGNAGSCAAGQICADSGQTVTAGNGSITNCNIWDGDNVAVTTTFTAITTPATCN